MAGVNEGAFASALQAEMRRTVEAITEQVNTPMPFGDLYANMTDAEREEMRQRAAHRNLEELGYAVGAACRAVYIDCHLWPTAEQRHMIAVALLSHECDPW